LLLQSVINPDAFKVVSQASLYLLALKPDDEDDMIDASTFQPANQVEQIGLICQF